MLFDINPKGYLLSRSLALTHTITQIRDHQQQQQIGTFSALLPSVSDLPDPGTSLQASEPGAASLHRRRSLGLHGARTRAEDWLGSLGSKSGPLRDLVGSWLDLTIGSRIAQFGLQLIKKVGNTSKIRKNSSLILILGSTGLGSGLARINWYSETRLCKFPSLLII